MDRPLPRTVVDTTNIGDAVAPRTAVDAMNIVVDDATNIVVDVATDTGDAVVVDATNKADDVAKNSGRCHVALVTAMPCDACVDRPLPRTVVDVVATTSSRCHATLISAMPSSAPGNLALKSEEYPQKEAAFGRRPWSSRGCRAGASRRTWTGSRGICMRRARTAYSVRRAGG